jgi:hypothetical protein
MKHTHTCPNLYLVEGNSIRAKSKAVRFGVIDQRLDHHEKLLSSFDFLFIIDHSSYLKYYLKYFVFVLVKPV